MATDLDTQTLDAITVYIEAHGFPPSMRELGGLLGITSTSSVKWRLDSLERAGLIERVQGKPRAIRLKERT